jgi:hypothetical protein
LKNLQFLKKKYLKKKPQEKPQPLTTSTSENEKESSKQGIKTKSTNDTPDTENPKKKQKSEETVIIECIICYDAVINTVILPCGHLCICWECSNTLTEKKSNCPLCRQPIDKIIKTYKA